ncbi:MAG: MarR family transcriptional regulator [Candidatus Dormibacteria bacterium]
MTAASHPGDLHGLTRRQVRAVRRLKEGGLTMQEFARALGLSGPSATALADRLVRSGAAKRRSDGEDLGVVRLLQTVAGTAMSEEYLGSQEAAVTRLVAALPVGFLAPLAGAMQFLSTIGGGRRAQSIVAGDAPHPDRWRRSGGVARHLAPAGEEIGPCLSPVRWPTTTTAPEIGRPLGFGAQLLAGSASLDRLAKVDGARPGDIDDLAAADIAGLAPSLSG